MTRTETAERSGSSRGIFRDLDGIAPAESLFQQEEPAAGGTERYHVSAAGDPEEIRAERTADQVMGGGSIFREADGPGAEGGEVELPSADLAGPGSALPAGIQQAMGASMGADFSGVRVHTGAGADRASRDLSARAFARGQDLYFRGGEYNPGSREGQHLIAHELAHVADGAEGLHRAYTAPEFPTSGNAPTSAEKKQIIQCTVSVLRTVNAAKVDEMEEKYLKKPPEEVSPDKADQEKLQDAKQALMSAEGYIQQLDVCLNHTGLTAEMKSTLEAQKQRLQDLMPKREKIDKILERLDTELGRRENAELSDSVKNMLTSPYFDQFFRAASQLQKAGKIEGFEEAEKSAAENTGSENVTMSAEQKREYIQHQNELNGVNTGTGLQKVTEGSKWMGKTGKLLSAAGESGAEVSESIGAVSTAHSIHKESAAIDKNDSIEDKDKAKEEAEANAANRGEAVAGIASASAEGLGAVGAGLSVIQNSKDAKTQRKQDQRAKQSMRNISSQLERTIPANIAEGSLSQGDDAARTRRIQKLCQQIKQDKFNDGKVPLSQLIADAMDDSPELKPELTGKQKSLLSTLQALESSRASSKKEAQKLRKDAIFGAFDTIGAGLKAAGGIMGNIGSLLGSTYSGLVGAILTLAGNVIGQIGAIRGKVSEGEDGGGEEDEQGKKMAACRAAIQQMAGLPPIRDKAVEALKRKAGGDAAQKVSGKTIESAEQYAAAFYTIESANVNMSDILFAIEKGEFGKKTGPGANDKKSVEDSLKDMYGNLSFS